MALIAPNIPIDEFITGEKFELLCDVDAEKDKDFLSSIERCNKNVVTVFSQTHELKNRIPQITKLNKKFIIVSHNSDGHIQYEPATRWFDYQWKPEKNIVNWFCQNVDVDEPTVTPLPISVENTYVFKPEQKQQYMVDLRDAGLKKEIAVFICYNPETNPGERKPPLKLFEDKPWATICSGYNNVDLYKPYFDKMARHQFVLCPEGNGMDTIRTWEALYLGCIPIVKPRVFTEWYAGRLPIIIVNDWKEVTVKLLINKLQEFDSIKHDWNVLKMSYWKNEIEKKVK